MAAARRAGPTGLLAVLDVGSSAFRLQIVDRHADGSWDVVDRAEKPVALGRDVFSYGRISGETLSRGVQVLSGFRELLAGWRIPPESTFVIGTSALREAPNGDSFVDRAAVRTGLKIELISEAAESQLTYLAVRFAIGRVLPQLLRSTALIIEVGGGHTTLVLVKRGPHIGPAHPEGGHRADGTAVAGGHRGAHAAAPGRAGGDRTDPGHGAQGSPVGQRQHGDRGRQ